MQIRKPIIIIAMLATKIWLIKTKPHQLKFQYLNKIKKITKKLHRSQEILFIFLNIQMHRVSLVSGTNLVMGISEFYLMMDPGSLFSKIKKISCILKFHEKIKKAEKKTNKKIRIKERSKVIKNNITQTTKTGQKKLRKKSA